MPIYRCSNGKYRIGEGECMYTSRSNAERAYVAYLAEEGDDEMKAVDNNKVSFDFDDTLTQERYQMKAMQLKEEGKRRMIKPFMLLPTRLGYLIQEFTLPMAK